MLTDPENRVGEARSVFLTSKERVNARPNRHPRTEILICLARKKTTLPRLEHLVVGVFLPSDVLPVANYGHLVWETTVGKACHGVQGFRARIRSLQKA
jgi:hypothetical protein